mgnify:CR=1 FL=1
MGIDLASITLREERFFVAMLDQGAVQKPE